MNPMNQTSHPPLDTARRRPQPLDRARRAVRGVPDDHPRPDDRERGAADDPERPALLAVGAGVGRQRVPDRVRRAAAARRPARRPDRAPAHLPRRADRVHVGVAGVRPGRQPGAADRRAVHPGRRRGDDLRRDPGDDRDDVPEAVRAGQGDRGLQLRGRGRRGDRPARRRRSDAGDQLALDLLRQRPDRDRDRRVRHPAAAERRRNRPRAGRGRTGRGAARQRR